MRSSMCGVLATVLAVLSAPTARAQTAEEAKAKIANVTESQMSEAWDDFEAAAVAQKSGNRKAAIATYLAGLNVYPGETSVRSLVASLLEAEGNVSAAVVQWKLVAQLSSAPGDKERARVALERYGEKLAAEPTLAAKPPAPRLPAELSNDQLQSLYDRAASDATAIDTLRKAAEQRNVTAQLLYGMILESGRGVAVDENAAETWYRESSALGNERARVKLRQIEARKDERNARLAEQQRLEAIAAEQARAEQALKRAQELFYRACISSNPTGFPEFELLAKQGEPNAQYLIGACYFNGYAVEKDTTEGIRWWIRASRNGHLMAKKSLQTLQDQGVMIDVIERTIQ
ncbi:MAG: tetratricopeptide repeat protein [Telluria sp.]